MATENGNGLNNTLGYGRKSYPTWADVLSIVGVFFVASIAVGFVVNSLLKSSGGFPLFLSYTLSFVIVIVYALLLKKYRTGSFDQVLAMSFKGFNPRIILWGIILMAAVSVVIEPLIDLFPSQYLERLAEKLNNGGWAMLTSLIAAPLFEEMLFRGIIQEGLSRKYGSAMGITVAAFIFGIVHIIPQQVVAATVLGFILGYIYYRTHSLIPVIILHALNNAFAHFSILFTDDITMTTREMIGSDKIYYMVYGACVVIVILSSLKILSNLRGGKQPPSVSDENPEITKDGTAG